MARYRSRRDRERSRALWKGLASAAVFLGVSGVLAHQAYQFGKDVAAREITSLREEVDRLTGAETAARDRADRLAASLATAQTQAAEYRQRYDAVAPPEVQDLLEQLRRRLAEGLPAERLRFAIAQAQEPRACSPADTRRFIVRTPASRSDRNSWVRFNNVVTVTAVGQGVDGDRDERFDAEAEVTLVVTPLGGAPQEVSGRLPLRHALVVKGQEYRLLAAPGARGFLDVTADWCEYGGE